MSAARDIKVKKPDPTDIYVGSRIRLQRNLVSMSQTELGDAVGITFQQIQKYEKGTNRVGASRLRQIAEVLGVQVSFFFDGAENNNITALKTDTAAPLMDFLGSKQGVELNRAFMKISNAKVREKAVQLIKALADNSSDKS